MYIVHGLDLWQPLTLVIRSYDDCDVGTLPNQTLKNHSGPAAALHRDALRDKYNFELSWLNWQRLSCVYLSWCFYSDTDTAYPSTAPIHAPEKTTLVP
jgi:hypothetical protein